MLTAQAELAYSPTPKLLDQSIAEYGDDVVAREIAELQVEGTAVQRKFADGMRNLLMKRWWNDEKTVAKVVDLLKVRTDMFYSGDIHRLALNHVNCQVA